ncbi:hypothetical protein XENORESO_005188 [Xenotaenia resolanae]|uniref:Uncharacterized protein n=1 Tax=Xenotaenia resolanae TaxID=208358 RepID=A0ABV0WYQ1_9TELE
MEVIWCLQSKKKKTFTLQFSFSLPTVLSVSSPDLTHIMIDPFISGGQEFKRKQGVPAGWDSCRHLETLEFTDEDIQVSCPHNELGRNLTFKMTEVKLVACGGFKDSHCIIITFV